VGARITFQRRNGQGSPRGIGNQQKEAEVIYLRLQELDRDIDEAKESNKEAEKEVDEFGHELVNAKVEEAEARTHLIDQRRVISGLEYRLHFDYHQESKMISSVFDNLNQNNCTRYLRLKGC